jgi:tRNA-dihydrouridine synthase
VINGGGGSNLLRDLPQLRKILTEVKRAISIPMTVKIRAGWDDKSINCIEVAKLIEDCGASMVTLHGRTRVQGYRGYANWDLVREIKQHVSIPVSGSGDILTPADALKRFDETSCDAVHIGRGAIANPYIFRQTWETMNGIEPYQPAPTQMHRSCWLLFRDYLREQMPRKGRHRPHVKMLSAQFLRGVPNAAHLRTAVLRSRGPAPPRCSPLVEVLLALAEKFGIDQSLRRARGGGRRSWPNAGSRDQAHPAAFPSIA